LHTTLNIEDGIFVFKSKNIEEKYSQVYYDIHYKDNLNTNYTFIIRKEDNKIVQIYLNVIILFKS
jgi:hypothetical protein